MTTRSTNGWRSTSRKIPPSPPPTTGTRARAPEETDVDRHLVIDELVRLGDLHGAVEDEDQANPGR